MVQQLMALAAKPDDMSLILWIHMVRKYTHAHTYLNK